MSYNNCGLMVKWLLPDAIVILKKHCTFEIAIMSLKKWNFQSMYEFLNLDFALKKTLLKYVR